MGSQSVRGPVARARQSGSASGGRVIREGDSGRAGGSVLAAAAGRGVGPQTSAPRRDGAGGDDPPPPLPLRIPNPPAPPPRAPAPPTPTAQNPLFPPPPRPPPRPVACP